MCGKREEEEKGGIYGLTPNDPTGKDYVLLNRVVHQGKASHLVYTVVYSSFDNFTIYRYIG